MRRGIPGETYLGNLCRKGHEFEGSGKTLRHKAGHCAECNKAARIRRAAEFPDQASAAAERKKLRDAKRRPRKPVPRPPMTPDRRREIGRNSKRKFRKTQPQRHKEYSREYYKRNSLKISIRNRVWRAMKLQGVKKVLTVKGYGIDIPGIIAHIGPCRGVRSEWHIDHIKPLCLFDFSDPAQVYEAFKPSNHQWLTASENLRKHAKYEQASR